MNTPTCTKDNALNEKALAQLKHMNVQLDALQTRIHEIAKAHRSQICQAATDLGLPVDGTVCKTDYTSQAF